MGVQGAEVALGQVEVPEGARYVALDGIDPAEVLLHDGQRQIQIELPAQALGLVQIRFGGRELMAVPVCDRAVGQNALQPQVISRPAQGGHGRPEAEQRGVELPEQVEDCPALRLRPGPGRAVKAGHRAGDLAHSLLRPAADAQRKGQPQPRLGGLLGRAGPVGQIDGRPQVTHRAVDVLQVRGGDPDGALGDGLGGEIALGVRLPHDRGGEGDRASRVGLREPQNLADPSGRAHPRSLARINPAVDVSRPGPRRLQQVRRQLPKGRVHAE